MSAFAFTITVTAQSGFDKQSVEVAYIQRVVDTAMLEFARGRGTVTSGTIKGNSPTNVSNTSLGSWSYSPGASKA